MLRQIVCLRLTAESTPVERAALRAALDRLGEIPQVQGFRVGEDLGLFDDNFDLAVELEFADLDDARRYVEHPVHVAYVREHATRIVAQRCIVQYECGGR